MSSSVASDAYDAKRPRPILVVRVEIPGVKCREMYSISNLSGEHPPVRVDQIYLNSISSSCRSMPEIGN